MSDGLSVPERARVNQVTLVIDRIICRFGGTKESKIACPLKQKVT
jgi:hypothetical protein